MLMGNKQFSVQPEFRKNCVFINSALVLAESNNLMSVPSKIPQDNCVHILT